MKELDGVQRTVPALQCPTPLPPALVPDSICRETVWPSFRLVLGPNISHSFAAKSVSNFRAKPEGRNTVSRVSTPVFFKSSTLGTERPTSYTLGRGQRLLTSRGPSVGACLGSKESVHNVTSRSQSSHVSAFPFRTGGCSQRVAVSEGSIQRDHAPLPMLIVRRLGKYDDAAHCSHRTMELFCSGHQVHLVEVEEKCAS